MTEPDADIPQPTFRGAELSIPLPSVDPLGELEAIVPVRSLKARGVV